MINTLNVYQKYELLCDSSEISIKIDLIGYYVVPEFELSRAHCYLNTIILLTHTLQVTANTTITLCFIL